MLRQIFLENLTQKVFAIALTTVLFVFVREDKTNTAAIDVRIIAGYPTDRVLVSDLPKQVRVMVEGSNRELRRVRTDDALTISLNGSETEFSFEPELFKLPERVRVRWVRPAAIAVRFEEKMVRQIPVKPQVDGTPEPGYRLVAVEVDPDEVEIEGPAGAVRDLDEVLTERIQLAGRNRSGVVRVLLAPLPQDVTVPGQATFAVTLTIQEQMGTRVLTGLPVQVRGVGLDVGDFEISQETIDVTLSGATWRLDALAPEELIAYVDATDIETVHEMHNRDVKFTPPKGINVVEIKPKKIAVVRRRPVARPPDAEPPDSSPVDAGPPPMTP